MYVLGTHDGEERRKLVKSTSSLDASKCPRLTIMVVGGVNLIINWFDNKPSSVALKVASASF